MSSTISTFQIEVPPIQVSFSMSARAYFSGIYLDEAASSAKAAGTLEHDFNSPRVTEHRQRVVTAIVMAAAAVEAGINEACCDVLDEPDDCGVDEAVVSMFELCWKEPLSLERRSALEKCEIFMKICAKCNPGESLDTLRGQSSWGKVTSLFRLRNLLMHFRPVTTHKYGNSGDRVDPQVVKIQKALESFVPPNAFSTSGEPFYPNRILGYGCALWAFTAAAEFLRDFGDASGFTMMPSYKRAIKLLEISKP